MDKKAKVLNSRIFKLILIATAYMTIGSFILPSGDASKDFVVISALFAAWVLTIGFVFRGKE